MDYEAILGEVTEAVRAAGQMLRDEARRPGGPRAQDPTHADIDSEVEAFLNERLTAIDPRFGWEAEEDRGAWREPRDEGSHRFVVDPNDGTREYLRGHRGPSVSVALLRGDEAVLGVVYAYAWPDDEGTLFAWAEGTEATRNGVPLAPFEDRPLSAREVVLVSGSAERAPSLNASLVEPARFVASASLATRIARVAAGDALAGTSLYGPKRHDYAGGLAILRAVGGDLYGPEGVVDLRAEGVSRCAAGGSAARELAAAPETKLEATHPHAPLAAPSREHVHDAGMLSRAQGCWFGQLAGDALGSLVEFRRPDDIGRSYPAGVRELVDGGTFDTLPGQPTDDSEMALALARSLLEVGDFDAEHVLGRYVDWLESRPFDLGNTVGAATRAGSQARKQGRPMMAAVRSAASERSQANGALMRLAPLGIFGAVLPVERLARHAREDARLTHPARACQDANVVFACSMAHAIAMGVSPEAVYAFACSLAEEMDADSVVRGALADAQVGPPDDFMHQMGWLRLALHNAFHQLLHASSLEEALVDTVGRGGDTDTNAAIAGALLGATHGRAAVPMRWQMAVLSAHALPDRADVRRPRPRSLWPVDAEIIPERLLLLARP